MTFLSNDKSYRYKISHNKMGYCEILRFTKADACL